MEEKKYGLIRLSKADKPKTTLKKNIFDSDSDEETPSVSKKINTSSGIRRQTQLDISRALTEDPNVFEYDSIYEDMKSQKESVIANDLETKEKPKPKYINSLLKFSENRKKENERRIERKIQKERESEGNQFEDKEQFVTNAYKEKLNEIKEADEREKRQDAIEELLDVKKQKDLSGFYRHLLNNDISSEKNETVSQTIDPQKEAEVPKESLKTNLKPKTNRQIRRRRSSSGDTSDETPETQIKVENKEKSQEITVRKSSESEDESDDNLKKDEKTFTKSLDSKQNINSDLNDENEIKNTERIDSQKEESNKIPKLNKREVLLKIFTKRTVGEAFTEAQMRYFQRKDNYVI